MRLRGINFKLLKMRSFLLYLIAMIFSCLFVHITLDRYLLYWVARNNPEYFFNDQNNLLYEYFSNRLFANFRNADVENLNLLMLSNFTIHPEDHQKYRMPLIGGMTGKLLVRGFGYCDQVNGVFAKIMSEQGEDVVLWGLRRYDGYSPHTVIKQRNSLQFYDFWIRPVKYIVANNNYISGDKNIDYVTNVYSSLNIVPSDFDNGYVVNEYSLKFRLHKLFKLLEKKLSIFLLEDDYIHSAVGGASSPGFNKEMGSLYVLARISLIKGNYSEAKFYLSRMLDNECLDYFCTPGKYLYSKL